MNGKRLILVIGVIFFIIVTSIVIFSIDWGGSDTPIDGDLRPVTISDYANTTTEVRMTIRGPVNSDQEHEDLQITVGRDSTTGELINGYQGEVTRSQFVSNNPSSYKTFLSALSNSGFTSRQLPQRGVQYDGACPKGVRYTFEFLSEDTLAPRSTWATSCSERMGTFAGGLLTVKNLFYAQIPKEQLDQLTDHTQF